MFDNRLPHQKNNAGQPRDSFSKETILIRQRTAVGVFLEALATQLQDGDRLGSILCSLAEKANHPVLKEAITFMFEEVKKSITAKAIMTPGQPPRPERDPLLRQRLAFCSCLDAYPGYFPLPQRKLLEYGARGGQFAKALRMAASLPLPGPTDISEIMPTVQNFLQCWTQLLSVKVPPIPALESIQPFFKAAPPISASITDMIGSLKKGNNLAAVFHRHNPIYPEELRRAVRDGINDGALAESLQAYLRKKCPA